MWNNSVSMNLGRQLTCLSLALLLSLLVISITAESHPPSNLNLEYTGEDGTLTVKIGHRVGNPSRHYVEKISIFKNGNRLLEKDYSEQPSREGGEYEYTIDVKTGDRIEVKGTCNRFGDISRSIVIEGVSEQEKVLLQGKLTAAGELSGGEKETSTSASGLIVGLLDKEKNELSFSLVYRGLSEKPLEIYFSKEQEKEHRVRTIYDASTIEDTSTSSPLGTSGLITGKWGESDEEPLTGDLRETLLSGGISVTIYTDLDPSREISGRLAREK